MNDELPIDTALLLNGIDCNQISARLHQGAYVEPEKWPLLRAHGFGLIVYCAEELQPAPRDSEIRTMRVAMKDCQHPHANAQATLADAMAKVVAGWRVRHPRERVMLTCQQGLNRSGLVMALVLVRAGLCASGGEATKLIRAKRTGSLFNSSFVEILESVRS